MQYLFSNSSHALGNILPVIGRMFPRAMALRTTMGIKCRLVVDEWEPFTNEV